MMKCSDLILTALILSLFPDLVSGQWKRKTVDQRVSDTYMIQAQDIEGDGDMDLFISEFGANRVSFFENTKLSWNRHVVDADARGALGLDLADFDNDGKLDVLAGNYRSNVVAWYRNEGGSPVTWEKRLIDVSLDGADVVVAEDINGDGKVDVVALGFDSGEIIWYENNYPEAWKRHIIGLNSKADGVICVADIDQDDKPDVLRGEYQSNRLVLYRNNLPDTAWTEITIDGNLIGAHAVIIEDIDNDGDLDMAATAREAKDEMADVAWYETDSTGLKWIKHGITSDLTTARGLAAGDLDGDADTDLVVTDVFSNDIIIFLNGGNGQSWTEQKVCDGFENLRGVFAFDVDLDGDIDLLPTSGGVNAFIWFENPYGSAHAVSLNTTPLVIHSTKDTLKVSARLRNPDRHPVNAWVFINGRQTRFADTLWLFDDGLHADSDSADNLWGNTILSDVLPEDEYVIDLFTYDSISKDTLGFVSPSRFFKLGPIEFMSYRKQASGLFCRETEPEPGGCLSLKICLVNWSNTATARNLRAELSSPDTLISFMQNLNISDFGEIPAGDSSVSTQDFVLSISDEWDYSDIPFEVNIYCYEHLCWRDTFSIEVDPTNVDKSIKEQLNRIYPNPADEILNIETCTSGQILIEIYTLNGQLVQSDRFEGSSHHQVYLTPLWKGIYLIKVRTRDSIEIIKLIKL